MAKFFIESNSIDIIEVEELLLSRYSNIDYILKLEFQEALELVKKAYEKDFEARLWEKWLVDYRNMDEKTFISFEDYKKKILDKSQVVKDKTSKEDLLVMAAEITDKISQKRGEE